MVGHVVYVSTDRRRVAAYLSPERYLAFEVLAQSFDLAPGDDIQGNFSTRGITTVVNLRTRALLTVMIELVHADSNDAATWSSM